MEANEAVSFLRDTVPFRYLPRSTLEDLVKNSEVVEFKEGSILLSPENTEKKVYVILSGKVSLKHHSNMEKVLDTLTERSYFGERSCVLKTKIIHTFVSQNCKCLAIPPEVFLSLCNNQGFSLSLQRSLREKQGVFYALENFRVHLSNSVSLGKLDFPHLVNLYKAMKPAIHHKMESSQIDTDSWVYALKRLPTNITSTFSIFMSKRITNVLSDEYMSYSCKGDVKTVARRRSTWNLLHGKIFVLLRDTSTDIIDFVSCLCLHQIEATKLREAIKSSGVAGDIRKLVAQKLETKEAQDLILKKMKITDYEKEGLRNLWPKTLIEEMHNILLQHGDYSIIIDQGLNNYNIDISEHWSSRVKKATIEAVGVEDEENLEVDIISSNTHSVVNCLSTYVHSIKDEVFNWARIHQKHYFEMGFKLEDDLLYSLAYGYFKEHPEKEEERAKHDREHGIITLLQEEDFTGITVQLILPEKLDPLKMDSLLKNQLREFPSSGKKRIIVNIDFAFGKQAEDIIGCLIAVFQRSIKSINILGKAGGLMGNRGDILLPTHILYQETEEYRAIPNYGLNPKDIGDISGRSVHVGPILTILGTLLQNRTLLQYYLQFYKTVGLEMEATFFARQIERAIMMGTVDSTIQSRFIYYVSDIPTDEHSTLSKSMSALEGVPPLYAITRIILTQIGNRYKAAELAATSSDNLVESKSPKKPDVTPKLYHWATKVIRTQSYLHNKQNHQVQDRNQTN